MINSTVGNDGFLGVLHAFLLIYNTVLLTISREMCEAKLKIVLKYDSEFSMALNVKTTKFFVINGAEIDKIPIQLDTVKIDYSCTYLYLGD